MGSLRQLLLIFIAFENGVEGDVFGNFRLCGLISVNVNIFDVDIFASIFVEIIFEAKLFASIFV